MLEQCVESLYESMSGVAEVDLPCSPLAGELAGCDQS